MEAAQPTNTTTTNEEEKVETSSETSSATAPADPVTELVGDQLAQKHPLQSTWTMWYNPASKNTSSKAWTSNVRPIWSYSTVEDFWRLFNNLVPPSRLPQGSNYHMFKHGVAPEWEDPYNRKGGKWVVMLPNKGEDCLKKLDECWMWVVLALIGEFFEDADQISGIVISPRSKQNRIALWVVDAQNEDACKRIGAVFKQNLNVQGQLSFQAHGDAIKHGNYRTTKYQV